MRLFVRLLFLAALVLVASAATAAAPFHVLKTLPVGGEGGWDDLTADAHGHRLFVSHSSRVDVVDLRTDSIVGRIMDTPGVHGIALAQDLGRGFTSNGRDSSVTMFDLATLAPLQRIKLPAGNRNPDAISYDPATKRVFTFNGGTANASVIDATNGAVLGTVPLGGRPEFAQVDGLGHLYVNLEDSSAVVVIDTRHMAVTARWALGEGKEPSGLALDRKRHRLFAACANEKCVVLDAANGRILATLPIGKGVDGIACDAARGLVLTSNGEGTMTVIEEGEKNQFRVLETVTTKRGARTMTLDESTGIAYTPTADFGPPPAPTPERPHPRPSIVPGTFGVLAVGR